MSGDPRVLVIGLDCAEPSLVFEKWRGLLPNISRLMEQGAGPVVVDVRSVSARQIDPRTVAGAIALDMHNLDADLERVPPDREIILYCT